MLEEKGFDKWSSQYDEMVKVEEGYPFEGYWLVLKEIINEMNIERKPHVLDVGIGTGILSGYLSQLEVKITGIDFSQKMLEIAKERVKNGVFYKHRIDEGMPIELKNKRYDYIISTYVMHHFTFNKKIEIIKELFNHLLPSGKILIGDVSFLTCDELEKCRMKYQNVWDHDEIYLVYDEIKEILDKEKINHRYKQISYCGGVLILSKS